jgi:hypothetical protein
MTPAGTRPRAWTDALIALGIVLRAYHYIRNPSVWHDEAALLYNVLSKGFRELWGPLALHEAGPPFFLWTERAVSRVLGEGTYALRLVPFVASCLALILTAAAARRLLPARTVSWAVLLLACSDRILWHTCEAKPYATDLFTAALVTALFLSPRPTALTSRLLLHAALAPLLMLLSFPACFIYGGLLTALLPSVWRARRTGPWLAYGALALAVGLSFGVLLGGPIRDQRSDHIAQCWTGQFPDWHRPWAFPWWAICSALDVGRYCFQPTGHVVAALAVLGAILLWRQGHRAVVTLLALPAGLALIAACLHAYPWGGARVDVFLAPAAALLATSALPSVLAWLRARAFGASLLLILLLLAPACRCGHNVYSHWPRAACDRAARYVMKQRHPEELVAAGAWEYLYYFRGLTGPFRQFDQISDDCTGRLWAVVTSFGPDRSLPWPLADERRWLVLERRHFDWTTVYLLDRRGPEPVATHVVAPPTLPARRAISAATYPALKPPSMLTTTTLAEQLLSMVSSGASP